MCFYSKQGRFQSGGGGGEAGRPDRVPETAQHFAQQEAAQPHCSALTAAELFLPVWLDRCALKAADLRWKTGSNELKHWIEECKSKDIPFTQAPVHTDSEREGSPSAKMDR